MPVSWRRLGLALIAGSLLCADLRARSRDELAQALSLPVSSFVFSNEDAKAVFCALGASTGVPIVVDPDVAGFLSIDLRNVPVSVILSALCEPRGWSFEATDEGYLRVRRFSVKVYPVDFLPLTQAGSSSASVSLSSGATPGQGPAASGVSSPSAFQLGAQAGTQSASSGMSTLNLTQQNDSDFWGKLEGDLRAMMGEGESVLVNRFAGLVQVKASERTHRTVGDYIGRVMERVGRQARISVRIVEVDLSDQQKTGIDWAMAASAIGKLAGSKVTLGASSTAGALPQVGALSFDSDTFTGTLGIGGVQAAISALSEQGTVHVEAKPEIAALNNQTAFVQISEDQPFFSRYNTTTINAGGVSSAGAQPITNTNYSQSTISFGNLLEITVQIADDLTTRLALCPAVTELKGTVTSPDGQETAPITGTKRARTTIMVRNHETAVIGGFITDTSGTQSRSVPGLGGIPLLGRAFGSQGSAHARSELVFLVTVNAEHAPRGPGAGANGPDVARGAAPSPSGVETIGL